VTTSRSHLSSSTCESTSSSSSRWRVRGGGGVVVLKEVSYNTTSCLSKCKRPLGLFLLLPMLILCFFLLSQLVPRDARFHSRRQHQRVHQERPLLAFPGRLRHGSVILRIIITIVVTRYNDNRNAILYRNRNCDTSTSTRTSRRTTPRLSRVAQSDIGEKDA